MSIQIKRIGHVGILVSDFEKSFKFYTEVMGCKVTNRRERPDGSEGAFLRFDETHHDFVIASAPAGVDVSSAVKHEGRLIQQIAFEVENRGEPFSAGNGGLDGLHHWLTRELVAAARDYELVVWRDGGVVSLSAPLALGPYR